MTTPALLLLNPETLIISSSHIPDPADWEENQGQTEGKRGGGKFYTELRQRGKRDPSMELALFQIQRRQVEICNQEAGRLVNVKLLRRDIKWRGNSG